MKEDDIEELRKTARARRDHGADSTEAQIRAGGATPSPTFSQDKAEKADLQELQKAQDKPEDGDEEEAPPLADEDETPTEGEKESKVVMPKTASKKK